MSGRFFAARSISVFLIPLIIMAMAMPCLADEITLPTLSLEIGNGAGADGLSSTLQILFLLTVLSLAPAILIMVTSFTRVVIVLSFVRNGIGTQQIPPNQVVIALALFLTFFIMFPVWTRVNNEGLQPYLAGRLSEEEAIPKMLDPIREFMFSQTRERDIALFVELSGMERPQSRDDVPTHVLIPAFMVSELKTAFQMGFMLFIPFLVIDIVVASTLMSMGMMMLPPVMISLPFKILLFVMVDGWGLIAKSLIQSFAG